MADTYEFSIVRLTSNDARDERLNVGVIVVNKDGLDVRSSRRLDKVHAMSAAIDGEQVRELLDNYSAMDKKLRDAGVADPKSRLSTLFAHGPITISEFGNFTAHNVSDYEERVASLLRIMVDPEPAPRKIREKRSKLLTEVKVAFRRERVLAKKGENIDSHRLVSQFEIDEGLTADLVLKNGAMHVIETVDASGDHEAIRRAVADIGVAALVLERARMSYGENNTKSRLVYSASAALERVAKPSLEAAVNQGAILTNWTSADDRRQFIETLSSLATPVPTKPRGKAARADFAASRALF